MYYCEICGKYHIEDDMVIYKCDTKIGKCRDCIRNLEASRKKER